MKIRQGFVSNSSSSSFIVAFPKGFKATKQNVKDYLFANKDYLFSYGNPITTNAAAETIYRDMRRKKPNVTKRLNGALSGHLDGAPDYWTLVTADISDREEWRRQWAEAEKQITEFRNKVRNQILEEWKEYDLYVFEYGDEDGSYFATLEHGPTFDAVPHKRISHH